MKSVLFLLCFVAFGTLGENASKDSHKLTLLNLTNHIQVVMNAAKYYLHEGAPSITKLFIVDNADEIKRLEGELKKKIVEDLLSQLVDAWADINRTVLRSFKVLKSLRDRGESLITELKLHGEKDSHNRLYGKHRTGERVRELLEDARRIFCVQEGNFTGLTSTEAELVNLTVRLEYTYVKNHLLKMVYLYKLDNLMNITLHIHSSEYKIIQEIWSMVSAWGKWAVLDMMAFIKEPLEDLHSDVEQYVSDLFNNMQELIEDALDNVLKIVTAIDNEVNNGELLEVIRRESGFNNPLYALCQW